MVPVWPLFVSGLFAALPVIFEGETDCPSREAISRELERIVAAPPGSEPTDTARVVVEGSETRIVLATKDGQILGERRLPAEGTCDERALSVAVVLGAWIATAHPEYLSTLPDRRAETPAVAAEPSPPSPSDIPPSVPPSRSPPPAERKAPTRAQPGVAWRFRAALGVGGELSDAGLVPATDVSIRFAPKADGFGVTAFALFAIPEERDVGSGRVSSFRWPLGAGGVGRFELGGVALEFDAGAMLGLLHVQGKGFSANDGATDVQGGVHGALRVEARTGRLRPFAATRVLTWLGRATASASSPDAEVDLPAVEGVFLVGVGIAL